MRPNGWFVVSSRSPSAPPERGALAHHPNAVPGWQREPVIAFSQVGYHPDQEKRALIEFPARGDLGEATLLLVRPGQDPVPVLSRPSSAGAVSCATNTAWSTSAPSALQASMSCAMGRSRPAVPHCRRHLPPGRLAATLETFSRPRCATCR